MHHLVFNFSFLSESSLLTKITDFNLWTLLTETEKKAATVDKAHHIFDWGNITGLGQAMVQWVAKTMCIKC